VVEPSTTHPKKDDWVISIKHPCSTFLQKKSNYLKPPASDALLERNRWAGLDAKSPLGDDPINQPGLNSIGISAQHSCQ